MNFEQFAPARDLFYLTFLLLGAALGFFLVILHKACTLRQRSVLISVILCLVSCAIASLAGAVILSGGLVVTVPALYPFAFFFLALGAVGIRFPREGGTAIIFASAVFLIWICFSFLIFPRFREPEQLLIRSSGEGRILVRRGITAQNEAAWNIQDDGRPVTFEAVSIAAHPAYPLIGGERRGIMTQATRKGDLLFVLAGKLHRHSFSRSPGFLLEQYSLDLPPGIIRPGLSLSVMFDGEHLYFDPPIQL